MIPYYDKFENETLWLSISKITFYVVASKDSLLPVASSNESKN